MRKEVAIAPAAVPMACISDLASGSRVCRRLDACNTPYIHCTPPKTVKVMNIASHVCQNLSVDIVYNTLKPESILSQLVHSLNLRLNRGIDAVYTVRYWSFWDERVELRRLKCGA